MKPLFLITNDDGYHSRGIKALMEIACRLGDVIVVAPDRNSSGLAHSFTGNRPIRVSLISENEGCKIYACDGTPVDCIKVSLEHICPRRPDLVLSGINHGSNSSINVLYSGTIGAVIEAAVCGMQAIGFSLLDYRADADFEPSVPYVGQIISETLANRMPEGVGINVNIPVPSSGGIKGVKVCRQSRARWIDSYEKRYDPQGRPYYWLSGKFECDDREPDTDQWALENGYLSIVPMTTDYTAYTHLEQIKRIYG